MISFLKCIIFEPISSCEFILVENRRKKMLKKFVDLLIKILWNHPTHRLYVTEVW